MKKTLKITAIAALVASIGANAQVPGMPERAGQNGEANSLSLTPTNPAPFQPGHQGAAPVATPADAAIPQSRPAAQSVTPASTGGAAAIATPSPSIPIRETITQVDAQLLELARLQQATERSRAELELLNAGEQIQEIRRRSMGTQTGLTEVPLLVGIMTNRGGLVAEFLANGAVLQVAEGEMVSPEWQLEKIRQTSVEIKRRGRNERHVLMFGGSARTP